MEIKTSDLYCIITPLSPMLDKREAVRIVQEFDNSKIIGLDMTFVKDCTIDFFEEIALKAEKSFVGLFNISSDIFTIFNIMELDKRLNLFVSEMDFKQNKHRILKRKLCLV